MPPLPFGESFLQQTFLLCCHFVSDQHGRCHEGILWKQIRCFIAVGSDEKETLLLTYDFVQAFMLKELPRMHVRNSQAIWKFRPRLLRLFRSVLAFPMGIEVFLCIVGDWLAHALLCAFLLEEQHLVDYRRCIAPALGRIILPLEFLSFHASIHLEVEQIALLGVLKLSHQLLGAFLAPIKDYINILIVHTLVSGTKHLLGAESQGIHQLLFGKLILIC